MKGILKTKIWLTIAGEKKRFDYEIECTLEEENIGYTDQGNFVCVLPSKKHVEAIKTAYDKIFHM